MIPYLDVDVATRRQVLYALHTVRRDYSFLPQQDEWLDRRLAVRILHLEAGFAHSLNDIEACLDLEAVVRYEIGRALNLPASEH